MADHVAQSMKVGMTKPSMEQVKELHVLVRREGQDSTRLLRFSTPVLHQSEGHVTGEWATLYTGERD